MDVTTCIAEYYPKISFFSELLSFWHRKHINTVTYEDLGTPNQVPHGPADTRE
jgi:hypothetical protein